MLSSHDTLLNNLNDSISEDSLSVYLEQLTNYFLFNSRTRSFDILSDNKDLNIKKQDTCIRMFMNMHNYVYKTLNECLLIEKSFIQNTASPYKTKHSPYIPDRPEEGYFKGNAFYELRKRDEFINILEDGYYHKELVLQVINEGVEYIKKTKIAIDNEVEAIKLNS